MDTHAGKAVDQMLIRRLVGSVGRAAVAARQAPASWTHRPRARKPCGSKQLCSFGKSHSSRKHPCGANPAIS